jgi:hypothetical protein
MFEHQGNILVKHFMKFKYAWAMMSALAWLTVCNGAFAQSSLIAYQGNLQSSGNAANGSFDFVFALFNAVTNGTQINSSVTNLDVPVINGLFTTALDFGTNAYAGGNRWLNISVRTNGSAGAFMPLIPRQAITASPLAVFALSGNQGPAGASGTTGQNATTVYGTANVEPALDVPTLLPGLTQTVVVPTNSVVYIATDGGMRTTSTAASGYSDVAVYLEIDENIPANGGYANLDIVNNAGTTAGAAARWSLSLTATLTAGTHTIAVYGYTDAGSMASYNGGSGTTDQGELTVMFLKQ